MAQTRLQSFTEAWLNIAIGYFVASAANWLVLPHWGYQVSPKAAAEIGLVFTFISLVRSYLIRRLFNWFHESDR